MWLAPAPPSAAGSGTAGVEEVERAEVEVVVSGESAAEIGRVTEAEGDIVESEDVAIIAAVGGGESNGIEFVGGGTAGFEIEVVSGECDDLEEEEEVVEEEASSPTRSMRDLALYP